MEKGLAMRLYLVSRKLYNLNIPILPAIIMRINRVLCSCDIPYTADIHPSVVLGHNALGCVIHERAIIKENVTILQNVTIGGRGQSGVPIIQPGVFIGAGAAILGGVVVGKNSKIGSNAVVISDVPEESTAVGVPSKILHQIENEWGAILHEYERENSV